ncbi:hypothetical protein [Kitasatospora cheerisanensis]|uniref:SIS domain-containing protein n=1 Tax=Kitasatospora cheerisanensis KCTC 2395 TaxID=1348663 RepID=A0A066Z480_9ACTN|nr:hypothetical protein KCH_30740 [Kitasatospora cheerisanensis KCTC 2395]
MFDDSLLDDPAALQRADRRRELLSLAGAGARIRVALRRADAAGVNALNPEGRPRAVLVAGHGGVLTAAAVLAALAVPSCQVWPLPPADARPAGPAFTDGESWQLPGWAGPLDLVVLASAGGREGGMINLAEQAYSRGCAIAVIAPDGSELAEAALQVRGLPLPFEPSAVEPDGADAEPDLPAEDPAALWAVLAPLLTLADRIGVAALAPARWRPPPTGWTRSRCAAAPTPRRTTTRRRRWPANSPRPSRCCGPTAPRPPPRGSGSPPPSPTGPACPR